MDPKEEIRVSNMSSLCFKEKTADKSEGYLAPADDNLQKKQNHCHCWLGLLPGGSYSVSKLVEWRHFESFIDI
jgi:hypothetical protein